MSSCSTLRVPWAVGDSRRPSSATLQSLPDARGSGSGLVVRLVLAVATLALDTSVPDTFSISVVQRAAADVTQDYLRLETGCSRSRNYAPDRRHLDPHFPGV